MTEHTHIILTLLAALCFIASILILLSSSKERLQLRVWRQRLKAKDSQLERMEKTLDKRLVLVGQREQILNTPEKPIEGEN